MLKSMLTRLRETRMQRSRETEAAEAGFTLIELMVVLLIIAILLAIAIPTFLGVANSAGDRAAQSNLTNGAHRGQGPVPERPDLRQTSATSRVTAMTIWRPFTVLGSGVLVDGHA